MIFLFALVTGVALIALFVFVSLARAQPRLLASHPRAPAASPRHGRVELGRALGAGARGFSAASNRAQRRLGNGARIAGRRAGTAVHSLVRVLIATGLLLAYALLLVIRLTRWVVTTPEALVLCVSGFLVFLIGRYLG